MLGLGDGRSAYGILMNMKKGVRRGGLTGAGFTIVETMIVLAVTGGLFVAIAATLAGRQNTAEFTHAVQSVQSQTQQAIDQVSAGFYPNANNFSCANTGGTVRISAGLNTQGTNQDCIFLGKVIQFGVQGTNPEQYRVYTVAGLQWSQCVTGLGTPFQNCNPTVIGVGADYTTYSTAGTLQYGLSTLWVRSNGNSGCTASPCSIGAVAFLMEPGSLSAASTSGYNSGAQQIDLIPLPNTSLNQTPFAAASAINLGLRNVNLTTTAPVNPSIGVQVCLVSGGTNQSALMSTGGSGRQLLVKVDIKSNRTCS